MEITPQIFTAKVMHQRLFPKLHGFTYNVYYLVLPLSQLKEITTTEHLAINRSGIISFYEKDYGDYTGDLNGWVKNILTENKLDADVTEVLLVTMPRILGYAFNPVSFYLCFDKALKLRATICEVNNTFGETHSYLCTKKNETEIYSDDVLESKKLFHVSPFLKREGYYKFRFSPKDKKLGIWIDFYNDDDTKQLVTSLVGNLQPLTKSDLRITFVRHPFITLKTIVLIHWQAFKLLVKGIKYVPKPIQLKQRLSKSETIEK